MEKLEIQRNVKKKIIEKYSNWQEKIMFGELWKVAAKYGNWQENIVNVTKS